MATEQSDKTAAGSWSVTVNRESPKQAADVPKAHPIVKPNIISPPPAAKHGEGGRSMTIHADAVPPPQPAAPASGSWSVTISHETPEKKKAPAHVHRESPAEKNHQAHVKIRRAATAHGETTPEAPGAAPKPAPQPAPAKIPLLPIAVCVGVILLAGTLFARHQKNVRLAEQQTAKAYAAVNLFISRGSELTREAPAHQQKLEAPIQELQSALEKPSSGDDFAACVERAITTVKAVEKSVLDTDTGEEQARQALTLLEQNADYGSLSQKVDATGAECKKAQQAVDSRCQALRKLIMAANQRLPSDRKR